MRRVAGDEEKQTEVGDEEEAERGEEDVDVEGALRLLHALLLEEEANAEDDEIERGGHDHAHDDREAKHVEEERGDVGVR